MDIEYEQFVIWKEAVERKSGVQITKDRENALKALVIKRAQQLEKPDVEVYLDWTLKGVDGEREWRYLLDTLLVKETHFFRHDSSIDFVVKRMLSLHHQGLLDSPFWVWSVGCSTGEEPYTIAIALDQACQTYGIEPNYGVIGSDISAEAIAKARAAKYRASRMGRVSKLQLREYFEDAGDGIYTVKEHIRRRVGFVVSNVQEDSAPAFARRVHVIFCQNVLIYFRRWKRRQIVEKLVTNLNRHGCLVLGLGEVSRWVPQGYRRHESKMVQAYLPIQGV